MTSASGVRWTTFPGVIATVSPALKASYPTGPSPITERRASSRKFEKPRTRFMPPSESVRLSALGLLQMKFAGAAMSRICRAAKRHRVLMLFAHPSDAGRRPFPPALNREERVRIGVEWKALPRGCAKPVILRQCTMTGVIRQTESAARCECHIFNRSSPSLGQQAPIACRAMLQGGRPSRRRRPLTRSERAHP